MEYDNTEIRAVPIKASPLNEHDIYAVTRIIVLVTITLTLFVMFLRAQFLDHILGIMFFYLYTQKMMNLNMVFYLGIGYIISIVLDLIWLICYTKGWWNPTGNFQVDDKIDRGIKQMVIVFSYALFFVKMGLLICMKLLADALKTQETR